MLAVWPVLESCKWWGVQGEVLPASATEVAIKYNVISWLIEDFLKDKKTINSLMSQNFQFLSGKIIMLIFK